MYFMNEYTGSSEINIFCIMVCSKRHHIWWLFFSISDLLRSWETFSCWWGRKTTLKKTISGQVLIGSVTVFAGGMLLILVPKENHISSLVSKGCSGFSAFYPVQIAKSRCGWYVFFLELLSVSKYWSLIRTC